LPRLPPLPLCSSYADPQDALLVLSFVGETRVLGLNADDELDEAPLPGFDTDAQVGGPFLPACLPVRVCLQGWVVCVCLPGLHTDAAGVLVCLLLSAQRDACCVCAPAASVFATAPTLRAELTRFACALMRRPHGWQRAARPAGPGHVITLTHATPCPYPDPTQTLWCGNVLHDQLVQATSSSVRLVDCATAALLAEWWPPAGAAINLAACSPSQASTGTWPCVGRV
jgi:hypothetical protein